MANIPLLSYAQACSSSGPVLITAIAQSDSIRDTHWHQHARGQLLCATKGLISVSAAHSRWVVPATHAVWIPPDVPHSLRSHGPFSGWSLYVAADVCAAMPAQPCVLSVSGLLREAVLRSTSWSGTGLDAAQSRLAHVMLDEMAALPRVALGLPMPSDTRLLRIAQALSERPGDDRSLDAWARWAGIAPRTMSRRFIAETGFSFTEWRQRVRLLGALELLMSGQSVMATALDMGYDNVSGFIALFRRFFGVTPGQYASSLGTDIFF
ncbi:AraC family transcriptional regulator [Lampropedia puyangensis]|uniref:AraC family transcriptional regulator n=1 Tax=Lampropedia puyangensis TaxID=1330072 RepID=A0A4S8EV52_9BURK|nr:AraC family transcriptional regulator [Lampropedia puyangensis]